MVLNQNVDCQKPLSTDCVFGKKTKMEMQSFLNMQKNATKLSLDGDFGPQSNAALEKFLKVNEADLTPYQAKVDGIVDTAVIKALQLIINQNRCSDDTEKETVYLTMAGSIEAYTMDKLVQIKSDLATALDVPATFMEVNAMAALEKKVTSGALTKLGGMSVTGFMSSSSSS